jgi:endonuclease I
VQSYTTLTLADVYAVLAFYLRHKHEIDDYVAWIYAESERKRQEWEKQYPPDENLRARIRAARLAQTPKPEEQA